MSTRPPLANIDHLLDLDSPEAVAELAAALHKVIEYRMSQDLAWLRDDGKAVERWDAEHVAWALAHLSLGLLRKGRQR